MNHAACRGYLRHSSKYDDGATKVEALTASASLSKEVAPQ